MLNLAELIGTLMNEDHEHGMIWHWLATWQRSFAGHRISRGTK
jgi:hypothetical protein